MLSSKTQHSGGWRNRIKKHKAANANPLNSEKPKGVRKRLLPYPQARSLQTILKGPNPRNHQGPRYLPPGSIRREGTPGRPFNPTFSLFPRSDQCLERKWGSGEVAKSSPLHNPAAALPFPISFWCQAHATRKRRLLPTPHTRKSLARPQPRGFGFQWPLHPPTADSSHLMNLAWTAGGEGWLYPSRPQHLRSRSRTLPHHSQP